MAAVVPLVVLSDPVAVAVDIGVWGVIHALTGWAAHRRSADRLQRDGWLLRPRAAERDGRSYERLKIRRWKDRLPEAGALFPGGVSKRHLPAAREDLALFAVETRRAELGHWWALAARPSLRCGTARCPLRCWWLTAWRRTSRSSPSSATTVCG